MLAILGLIILAAAAVIGVVGVLGNLDGGHTLTGFSVFGYHAGSTGTLFLSGIVVGAAALLGLTLLLAGARRSHAARRGFKQHRETTDTTTARGDRRRGRLHPFGHRAAHR
ncbi:hypothetical protein [Streptomyces sp. NPDC005336]|uniref:hypothetical protein n=1 Tax=Streptomyces sp. NPDC005336 TaxID=3157035 RepID=UPI0033A48055